MKSIFRLIFVSSITIGFIYPGCGSCNVNKVKSVLPNGDFITRVNQDGIVKGLVLASCGSGSGSESGCGREREGESESRSGSGGRRGSGSRS